MIALQIVDTQLAQHLCIRFGFHPFSDHRKAKGTCEIYHAFHENLVFGFVGNVGAETAIELDHRKRQLHKIAIRSIPRSKII